MQHGAPSWSIVATLLEKMRLSQLYKYGCDCNRDILGLVSKEPAFQGEVEFIKRKQFGHIYMVVIRKNSAKGTTPAQDDIGTRLSKWWRCGGYALDHYR